MSTFEWSPLFETGLEKVDEQHRHLVSLVNQLDQDIDSASAANIDRMLGELAEYTVYHFRCEEEIMAAAGVAEAHARHHKNTHQGFVAQVTEWLTRRQQGEAISLRQLLDFLANWLIFHILGDDRALGRQVQAIRQGSPAEAAYAADRSSDDPRTEILLGALRRLYAGLVARNEELLAAQQSLSELNAHLEKRVELRTAELQEANARLREEQDKVVEAEKMASLGRMVAGFAHEVNTPVGVAVGVISQARDALAQLRQLLTRDEVSEEELEALIGLLDETTELGFSSIRRAAELVKSFKRTAVDQASEAVSDYDLAELIQDVLHTHYSAFKHTGIVIKVDCPAPMPLHGPAGIVIQILSNLLMNSRLHAFSDGQLAGQIEIIAHRAGDRACIEFKDDGAGMSQAVQEQAFEPFFTTRRGLGGSGLGLYIVYNLVTQGLKGSIRCDSATGKGTRFLIDYPAALPNTVEKSP